MKATKTESKYAAYAAIVFVAYVIALFVALSILGVELHG